jgi:hypothetical protein
VKIFNKKGPKKWFGCFWFFNHSFRWFLVVPPKDGFAHKNIIILSHTSIVSFFNIILVQIVPRFQLGIHSTLIFTSVRRLLIFIQKCMLQFSKNINLKVESIFSFLLKKSYLVQILIFPFVKFFFNNSNFHKPKANQQSLQSSNI